MNYDYLLDVSKLDIYYYYQETLTIKLDIKIKYF